MIGEVIADIFTAGNLYAHGKLPELEDSRRFMGDIIDWAVQFEEAFAAQTRNASCKSRTRGLE